MKKKLHLILLVDDDDDCNFFHERLLKKMECVERIHKANDGVEALEFLRSKDGATHPQPAIIFLDINMPRMNGWEFLAEYEKLEASQKGQVVLVMLTTSLNPDDKERALKNPHVSTFANKYLDNDALTKILQNFFPDYL